MLASVSGLTRTASLYLSQSTRMASQHYDRPWGIYSGYFRDLDGHMWSVLTMPGSANAGAYVTLIAVIVFPLLFITPALLRFVPRPSA